VACESLKRTEVQHQLMVVYPVVLSSPVQTVFMSHHCTYDPAFANSYERFRPIGAHMHAFPPFCLVLSCRHVLSTNAGYQHTLACKLNANSVLQTYSSIVQTCTQWI